MQSAEPSKEGYGSASSVLPDDDDDDEIRRNFNGNLLKLNVAKTSLPHPPGTFWNN
jgi:hypothetical protein